MRKTLIICIGALAMSACLSSCGFKKEKVTAAPPVKVTVEAVGTSAENSSRTYSGTIESGNEADMSFPVGGTIKKIYVNVGQKVSKGQVLAEIDGSDLIHANNMAQATLTEAQDAYNRMKKLHDANALPDIQWVDVQAKLKQAQNAAAISAKGVRDAKIYSPISGVVAEKFADDGQTVAPAIPVVKIVGVGDVKVSISVPEKEVGHLKAGRKAIVTSEAVSGKNYEGILTEQGVVANPLSHTFDVKFTLPNSAGELLPGMLCDVKIEADANDMAEKDDRIIVPVQSVLLSSDNRNFVWLAKNKKAVQQFVTAGDMLPTGIVITAGLNRGDTIITQGMQKVSSETLLNY